MGTQPSAHLVVLEGRVRLMAYSLAPEHIPDELEAIVGYSPGMMRWGLYGTRVNADQRRFLRD